MKAGHSKEPIAFCEKHFYESRKDAEEVYPVNDDTSQPRGYAVIINIKKDRRGSAVDQKLMISLFAQMNYEVILGIDKTKKEILRKLKHISKDARLKNHDSIVVFSMAHGLNGQIRDVNETIINCGEIFECFDGVNCRALLGKPKIFFFQSCRGVVRDFHTQEKDEESEAVAWEDDSVSAASNYGDRVISYATISDHVARRHTEDGSRYINAIWEVFKKHARDTHILDLLTKVNLHMHKSAGPYQYSSGKLKASVQCAEKTDSLQKFFYFFPRKPHSMCEAAEPQGDDEF